MIKAGDLSLEFRLHFEDFPSALKACVTGKILNSP